MNKLIKCLDSGSAQELEETLKGCSKDGVETYEAVSYAFRRRKELKRFLDVFRTWYGFECIEDLKCVSFLRTRICGLIAVGDVNVLKRLTLEFEENTGLPLDLKDCFKIGKVLYGEKLYDNLLAFVITVLNSNNKILDYLLTDAYLPQVIASDMYSEKQVDEMLGAAIKAAVTASNSYAVDALLKCVKNVKNLGYPCWLVEYAATNGMLDVIQRFVSEYRSVAGSSDNDGNTPLHLAAAKGHLDVVKLLYGKVTYKFNDYDETPFYLAVMEGRIDVVEFFVFKSARSSLGHRADCEQFDRLWRECSRSLKSNPNAWDWTHLACAHGHADIYKLLLRCGADPDRLDYWGMRAADYLEGYKRQTKRKEQSNGNS